MVGVTLRRIWGFRSRRSLSQQLLGGDLIGVGTLVADLGLSVWMRIGFQTRFLPVCEAFRQLPTFKGRDRS